MFYKCRLAGADGTRRPLRELFLSSTPGFYSRHCHSQSWLSVSVMSLVRQPDPTGACSNEQHNVEIQDKIDTEQDDEAQ